MYHSHTNEVADVNPGLLGPMIITAPGRARSDGSPTDVDRELVTAFAQTAEDESWFSEDTLPARMPLLLTDRPQDRFVALSHFHDQRIRGGLATARVAHRATQRAREVVRVRFHQL